MATPIVRDITLVMRARNQVSKQMKSVTRDVTKAGEAIIKVQKQIQQFAKETNKVNVTKLNEFEKTAKRLGRTIERLSSKKIQELDRSMVKLAGGKNRLAEMNVVIRNVNATLSSLNFTNAIAKIESMITAFKAGELGARQLAAGLLAVRANLGQVALDMGFIIKLMVTFEGIISRIPGKLAGKSSAKLIAKDFRLLRSEILQIKAIIDAQPFGALAPALGRLSGLVRSNTQSWNAYIASLRIVKAEAASVKVVLDQLLITRLAFTRLNIIPPSRQLTGFTPRGLLTQGQGPVLGPPTPPGGGLPGGRFSAADDGGGAGVSGDGGAKTIFANANAVRSATKAIVNLNNETQGFIATNGKMISGLSRNINLLSNDEVAVKSLTQTTNKLSTENSKLLRSSGKALVKIKNEIAARKEVVKKTIEEVNSKQKAVKAQDRNTASGAKRAATLDKEIVKLQQLRVTDEQIIITLQKQNTAITTNIAALRAQEVELLRASKAAAAAAVNLRKVGDAQRAASRVGAAGFKNLLIANFAFIASLAVLFGAIRIVGEALGSTVVLENEVVRAFRTARSETLELSEAFEVLRTTASDTMVRFGRSAKDVNQVLFELGSAGLSVEESLAAIDPVMKLLIGTEGNFKATTRIVAGIFNNFGDQVAKGGTNLQKFTFIVNVLTRAVKDNLAELDEFVQGFKFAIPVGKEVGLAFEEITAILGTLNNNLIKSGIAGRGVQVILQRIAAQPVGFAEAFGIEVDPKKPLDFLNILEKVGKLFKENELTAEDIGKVFERIGLRGAKSFIVLAENFEELQQSILDLREGALDAADAMQKIRQASPGEQLRILRQQVDAFFRIGTGDTVNFFTKTLLPGIVQLNVAMIEFNKSNDSILSKLVQFNVNILILATSFRLLAFLAGTSMVKSIGAAILSLFKFRKLITIVTATIFFLNKEGLRSFGVFRRFLAISSGIKSPILIAITAITIVVGTLIILMKELGTSSEEAFAKAKDAANKDLEEVVKASEKLKLASEAVKELDEAFIFRNEKGERDLDRIAEAIERVAKNLPGAIKSTNDFGIAVLRSREQIDLELEELIIIQEKARNEAKKTAALVFREGKKILQINAEKRNDISREIVLLQDLKKAVKDVELEPGVQSRFFLRDFIINNRTDLSKGVPDIRGISEDIQKSSFSNRIKSFLGRDAFELDSKLIDAAIDKRRTLLKKATRDAELTLAEIISINKNANQGLTEDFIKQLGQARDILFPGKTLDEFIKNSEAFKRILKINNLESIDSLEDLEKAFKAPVESFKGLLRNFGSFSGLTKEQLRFFSINPSDVAAFKKDLEKFLRDEIGLVEQTDKATPGEQVLIKRFGIRAFIDLAKESPAILKKVLGDNIPNLEKQLSGINEELDQTRERIRRIREQDFGKATILEEPDRAAQISDIAELLKEEAGHIANQLQIEEKIRKEQKKGIADTRKRIRLFKDIATSIFPAMLSKIIKIDAKAEDTKERFRELVPQLGQINLAFIDQIASLTKLRLIREEIFKLDKLSLASFKELKSVLDTLADRTLNKFQKGIERAFEDIPEASAIRQLAKQLQLDPEQFGSLSEIIELFDETREFEGLSKLVDLIDPLTKLSGPLGDLMKILIPALRDLSDQDIVINDKLLENFDTLTERLDTLLGSAETIDPVKLKAIFSAVRSAFADLPESEKNRIENLRSLFGSQSKFLAAIASEKSKLIELAFRFIPDSEDPTLNTIEKLNTAISKLFATLRENVPGVAVLLKFKLEDDIRFGADAENNKLGGFIGGSGSGDVVPAMLEPGEFVIRKKAVDRIGIETLRKINRFQTGGSVGIGSFSIKDMIRSISDEQDFNFNIALAIAKIESQFNPRARSRKGALGVMQITDIGEREVERRTGKDLDRRNIIDNIFIGIRTLRHDIREFGLEAGIAAYNIGQTFIRNEGFGEALKIEETRNFVSKVLNELGIVSRESKVQQSISGSRDTVPAFLEPGEFVVNKSSVREFGVSFFADINKFKNGGTVPGASLSVGATRSPILISDNPNDAVSRMLEVTDEIVEVSKIWTTEVKEGAKAAKGFRIELREETTQAVRDGGKALRIFTAALKNASPRLQEAVGPIQERIDKQFKFDDPANIVRDANIKSVQGLIISIQDLEGKSVVRELATFMKEQAKLDNAAIRDEIAWIEGISDAKTENVKALTELVNAQSNANIAPIQAQTEFLKALGSAQVAETLAKADQLTAVADAFLAIQNAPFAEQRVFEKFQQDFITNTLKNLRTIEKVGKTFGERFRAGLRANLLEATISFVDDTVKGLSGALKDTINQQLFGFDSEVKKRLEEIKDNLRDQIRDIEVDRQRQLQDFRKDLNRSIEDLDTSLKRNEITYTDFINSVEDANKDFKRSQEDLGTEIGRNIVDAMIEAQRAEADAKKDDISQIWEDLFTKIGENAQDKFVGALTDSLTNQIRNGLQGTIFGIPGGSGGGTGGFLGDFANILLGGGPPTGVISERPGLPDKKTLDTIFGGKGGELSILGNIFKESPEKLKTVLGGNITELAGTLRAEDNELRGKLAGHVKGQAEVAQASLQGQESLFSRFLSGLGNIFSSLLKAFSSFFGGSGGIGSGIGGGGLLGIVGNVLDFAFGGLGLIGSATTLFPGGIGKFFSGVGGALGGQSGTLGKLFSGSGFSKGGLLGGFLGSGGAATTTIAPGTLTVAEALEVAAIQPFLAATGTTTSGAAASSGGSAGGLGAIGAGTFLFSAAAALGGQKLAQELIGKQLLGTEGQALGGQIGTAIGAVAGVIIGTIIFPVVGTIIGAFVGAFAGDAIGEILGAGFSTRAGRDILKKTLIPSSIAGFVGVPGAQFVGLGVAFVKLRNLAKELKKNRQTLKELEASQRVLQGSFGKATGTLDEQGLFSVSGLLAKAFGAGQSNLAGAGLDVNSLGKALLDPATIQDAKDQRKIAQGVILFNTVYAGIIQGAIKRGELLKLFFGTEGAKVVRPRQEAIQELDSIINEVNSNITQARVDLSGVDNAREAGQLKGFIEALRKPTEEQIKLVDKIAEFDKILFDGVQEAARDRLALILARVGGDPTAQLAARLQVAGELGVFKKEFAAKDARILANAFGVGLFTNRTTPGFRFKDIFPRSGVAQHGFGPAGEDTIVLAKRNEAILTTRATSRLGGDNIKRLNADLPIGGGEGNMTVNVDMRGSQISGSARGAEDLEKALVKRLRRRQSRLARQVRSMKTDGRQGIRRDL